MYVRSTAGSRIMGPHIRQIGEHATDGEAIHQSAIDRLNFPECNYNPENLQAYLAKNNARVVKTRRIARGKPCG